jgi:hypothetical protein
MKYRVNTLVRQGKRAARYAVFGLGYGGGRGFAPARHFPAVLDSGEAGA